MQKRASILFLVFIIHVAKSHFFKPAWDRRRKKKFKNKFEKSVFFVQKITMMFCKAGNKKQDLNETSPCLLHCFFF